MITLISILFRSYPKDATLHEAKPREILREQPDNIPAFAAAYFENLLEKRESKLFKNRL